MNPMPGLRISSSINLHSGSRENPVEYFAQGLAFLRDMGFDAADMPSFFFNALGDEPEKGISRIHQAAQENGIRVELCHLPFGLKPDATQEETELFNASVHRAIDAAVLLGVDHAVIHPHVPIYPIDEFNEKENHETVMRHLTPFAEHAAKAGLSMVLENMRNVRGPENIRRYCSTPEELCAVADALGLGICWDFGHAHLRDVKPSDWLRYMGKRIKMLHVHDNYPYHDAHLAPFMGKIDWQDAMQGLKAIGYQGLFNYEVAAYRIPAPAREDFARLLVKTAKVLLDMME